LDEDEDKEEDEEVADGVTPGALSTGLPDVDETTTLLASPTVSRSRSRSRRRRSSLSRQGNATVTQAVLMASFGHFLQIERLTNLYGSCLNLLLEPVYYSLERRMLRFLMFYGHSDENL